MKKTSSLAQPVISKVVIDHWIHQINKAVEATWDPKESWYGRKVPIETTMPELVAKLAQIYRAAGWHVYGIQSGGVHGHAVEFYLEFWRRKKTTES